MSPQDIFNAIVKSEDMPTLESALERMKALPSDQKQLVLNALEKAIESEFGGMTEGDAAVIDAFSELLFLIEGDEEALFEMQAPVVAAKAVLEEKGDEASPVLKILEEKISELTDAEYNSVQGLTKAFTDVSVKVGKMQPSQPKPKNPFSR